MYQNLLKPIVIIPEQYVLYWEKTLQVTIDEWDWYEHFTECLKWTISTKLRSFYFQIRSLDIMTNHKLVKMKLKTDPSCTWCNCKDQTIIHLFWDCSVTNQIWQEISKWLSIMLDNWLEIKKELIFLHDIEAGNYTVIINLIILIVTRYMYTCKCIGTKPNTLGAIQKIKDIERIERRIT